jgi:XRE family transcriptional regulator, aerobic/anaerobic benzoate catabolism transcriptional regulator
MMLPTLQQHETAAAGSPQLLALARRVRQLRARRGMSRRILAAASGVSERYIAQLEAAKGNPSILVLAAIAEAMNIALDLLVDPRAEQPTEYLLLRERLRVADETELRRMAAALRNVSGGGQGIRHVALLGLRGAGKSTLGAALAKRLGVPFVELVQEIERAAGTAVSEILAHGGQTAYRRFERSALEASLSRFDCAVIAVGGSLVSEPETFELLLASCITVWLKASPREHMERVVAQGDFRPMADNADAMSDLKRMLEERADFYARAGFSVDTSGHSVDQTLMTLLELPPVRALATVV